MKKNTKKNKEPSFLLLMQPHSLYSNTHTDSNTLTVTTTVAAVTATQPLVKKHTIRSENTYTPIENTYSDQNTLKSNQYQIKIRLKNLGCANLISIFRKMTTEVLET